MPIITKINSKIKPRTKNYLALLFITFVFIGPIIAAQLYFYYGNSTGGISNGTLITDVHNISELNLNLKQQYKSDKYNPKLWSILYLAPENCSQNCSDIVYKIQQVHLALGKNLHRLQRVIIHKDTNSITDLNNNWLELYNNYPHLTEAYLTQDISNILSFNKLYLIDPLGNIILSYDLEIKNNSSFAEKLLQDTKKLLKLSNIG